MNADRLITAAKANASHLGAVSYPAYAERLERMVTQLLNDFIAYKGEGAAWNEARTVTEWMPIPGGPSIPVAFGIDDGQVYIAAIFMHGQWLKNAPDEVFQQSLLDSWEAEFQRTHDARQVEEAIESRAVEFYWEAA